MEACSSRSPGTRRARTAVLLILCAWNLSVSTGCERAPREPTDPQAAPSSPPAPQETPAPAPAPPAPAPDPEPEDASCVVPLADPPPPEVGPIDDCPPDEMGRPEMPYGRLTFPDAPTAPELRVELALTDPHRTHGLMFRPTLKDDEGMLFSWTNEVQRSFWMHNTCLALDMLFIAKDGTIAGILENVPPWNDTPHRTVSCPAAHVLEVRAGWTRAYGVKPGQKMLVGEAKDDSTSQK